MTVFLLSDSAGSFFDCTRCDVLGVQGEFGVLYQPDQKPTFRQIAGQAFVVTAFECYATE
jgi:hypothetical protein